MFAFAKEFLEHPGFNFRFELGIVRADIHALPGMEEPLLIAEEHAFRAEPGFRFFVATSYVNNWGYVS